MFRAIWHDKRDVMEWDSIREVLADFDLGAIDDESDEVQTVQTSTAYWRKTGEDRIPMIRSLVSSDQWHGLGQRSELMTFVGKELDHLEATIQG